MVCTLSLIYMCSKVFRRIFTWSYHDSNDIKFKFSLRRKSNLFTAAKSGDSKLLSDLLDVGYKPNHQDKFGKTALHHAVEGQNRKKILKNFNFRSAVNIECVKILLTRKARTNIRDNFNRTPLQTLGNG